MHIKPMVIYVNSTLPHFFGAEQERAAERIQRVMLFHAAYRARLAKMRAAFAKDMQP